MDSLQLELPITPLRYPDPVGSEVSIQERFEAFHELNPWICDQLEALTADCIHHGSKRVGIAMLFEVLRWQYGRATAGQEPWRLNNSYRSRYVRLLLERRPEWVAVFETRRLHRP